MNKEEYIEMRQEFASMVYSFEFFMKNGFLTDCKYNDKFYDILTQLRDTEIEMNIITNAIKEKSNNISITEILPKIEKAKSAYGVERVQSINKHKYCNQLMTILSKFDKSAFEASETHFKNFIINYHPVVCLNTSEDARKAYETLKRFYFENNFVGFQEYLNTNIKFFEVEDIKEDRYVEASQVYFKFRQTISDTINKCKTTYPYNKIELFADDIVVLAEKDELELKLKKAKEQLAALRKDFVTNFGFELKIKED